FVRRGLPLRRQARDRVRVLHVVVRQVLVRQPVDAGRDELLRQERRERVDGLRDGDGERAAAGLLVLRLGGGRDGQERGGGDTGGEQQAEGSAGGCRTGWDLRDHDHGT